MHGAGYIVQDVQHVCAKTSIHVPQFFDDPKKIKKRLLGGKQHELSGFVIDLMRYTADYIYAIFC